MIKHYINKDTLEIIKSNRAPANSLLIPEELKNKAVKLVDEEIFDLMPVVLKDKNNEYILDENGDVQYVTDENGEVLLENTLISTIKKVVLDEEAQALKEQQQAQNLEQRKWDRLRANRKALLEETDYIMMPDYPMQDKSSWETYRQALRDITENLQDPELVQWPEKPE